ncbi:molybdenum cofactor cytidylyltransferase-like isoform X2 [Entelurus aequoreus]|uniref:molybdenum cofactor cytidylyltransferase-like isoform X2 n=1 Tax=Entelurus aequoreus TaxID=161455 RepID=UPI002B1D0F54|nr:molybdenum cofactor cytidylyltransferase-like isoform X2 [Entelurus aequoreus]
MSAYEFTAQGVEDNNNELGRRLHSIANQSALNTPAADELPGLLKPVQTCVPGQNVATCSSTHSSVPASQAVCLVSLYSLWFPGCLLDLNLPPGHGLLTPRPCP